MNRICPFCKHKETEHGGNCIYGSLPSAAKLKELESRKLILDKLKSDKYKKREK